MPSRRNRIIVCVIFGLATTVVIALLCSLLVQPASVLVRTESFHGFGCIKRDHWSWSFVLDQGFGSTQLVWTAYPEGSAPTIEPEQHADEIPWWSGQRSFAPDQYHDARMKMEFIEDARGWPFPALYSWRKANSFGTSIKTGGISRFVYRREVIESSGWLVLPDWMPQTFRGSEGFSLWPRWRGLLADSLFFALIWFMLLSGPGAVRRWNRRRRGRCPACGYDLHAASATGCPECGWGRPPHDDGTSPA